jgi:hypothetical protein
LCLFFRKENWMSLKLVTAAKRAVNVVAMACGVSAVLAALTATAFAGGPLGAPEIDPNCAASALTLLAGGVLLIKGRFRR